MENKKEYLVKLLEGAHFTYLHELGGGKMWDRITDYLIAHGVTVQEWISVKDELPVLHIDDCEEPDGSRMQFEVSDDQWVITASKYQTKARYEAGPVFQGWVDEFGGTVRDVTHWMPLPGPPEEV